LSGREFAKLLTALEYEITRQSGSHIRLTTQLDGEHHLTVPDHDPMKIGTIGSALRALAEHHGLERDELMRKLFG